MNIFIQTYYFFFSYNCFLRVTDFIKEDENLKENEIKFKQRKDILQLQKIRYSKDVLKILHL